MTRKATAWDKFGTPPTFSSVWIDRTWTIGLMLAALLLYTLNLGGAALRDWDEGLIAQVARDIFRAPPGSWVWLHPTLAGAPYLNKPPFVHWLIAIAYRLGGVNEWTTRLPAALLSATSVPLLYRIGREIFSRRTPAIFAALVYLTTLPIARHGRLAMLDGVLISLFLLLLLCLLRSRRDLRWGLGVGIAFGLLCLTKGIAALLLGTIVLGFVYLDTPRLLTSGYIWAGVGLGTLPAIGWFGAQWWHYGQEFLRAGLLEQSFSRVWTPVENNKGAPWFYLLEVLKYGLPWLVFLPGGLRLAWENRNWSWAKLVLLWSVVYLVAISLMSTKLPWYVLPLYPALALTIGAYLAEICSAEALLEKSPRSPYPIAWAGIYSFAAIVCAIGGFYLGIEPPAQLELTILLAALTLTFTATTVLLLRQDSQFILLLLWGMYVSLLLLTQSRYWVWELGDAYPVKPVAAIVQQYTPVGQIVQTSYPYNRPSLNFYSDRPVIPETLATLKRDWQRNPRSYFLVDQAALDQLGLESARSLGQAEGWSLITRSSIPSIQASSLSRKQAD
ncbi:MAG TPA: glycosyltransferase family 39 protein [Thermosynechococcaceae cyanobacterium]